VAGAAEVLVNWEAIKRREKEGRPLLDGIPRALPALLRADKVAEKVSRVGFDWPDARGPREKVDEELRELDRAVEEGNERRVAEELGDLLFSLVNFARHHGINAEEALSGTMDRFRNRFDHVERRVKESRGEWPLDAKGKPTRGVPMEELDDYWREAKGRMP
jgi:tetrapyrrole methylase family protein/MazG family protein/ATP diphosphatase